MTKALTAVAVLLCLAATGIAHEFTLDISDPTEAFLINTGSTPIQLAGYEICSASGSLNVAEWISIRSCLDGPNAAEIIAVFGPDVEGLGLGNPNVRAIGEIEVVNEGFAWPVGFALSIGNPCPNSDVSDLTFNYCHVEDGVFGVYAGEIVPEPATMSLLGLGALTALRRRRRG